MNYLAHLFLSGNNEGVILGNLLEDFVSGNIENSTNSILPKDVKLGLQLHRTIDTFTDTHKVVKECKEVFYPNFGKYSPIVVDVLFDHFLIKNWLIFTEEDFEQFRKRLYNSLKNYQEIQPEILKGMIISMTEHDWLKNYSENWGLEKAFKNLNSKINKPEIDLTLCLKEFEENYYFLNEKFLDFFEDLKKVCDKFLIDNKLNGK
jgi:acyl carrier protein phosphodiesterase